jgi:carbonic anhydrase
MISALEALARLRAGNKRYVDNVLSIDSLDLHARRTELVPKQTPSAVILGCADSRVPPELVFDQGLGDLFVVRVAGNVVTPSQMGSIEFAVDSLGCRLVVVLGHTQCGAVKAAVQQGESTMPQDLGALIDQVRRSVDGELETHPLAEGEDPIGRAVRANVRASARSLRSGSPVLEGLIRSDGLVVIGAEYALETGEVDFFDGVDELE